MIMDCGKPMIIGFRACALLRHAPAHPYCRALLVPSVSFLELVTLPSSKSIWALFAQPVPCPAE
jgi:hypothetical protein